VTTHDARERGIDDSALRKREGTTLERIARGIYWLIPEDGERKPTTTLHAAVLHARYRYARRNASRGSLGLVVASNESALALYKLGDHPEKPTLTVPARYREYEQPGWYQLTFSDVKPTDVCEVEGIPCASPTTALKQIGKRFDEAWDLDSNSAFARIESRIRHVIGSNPSVAQSRLVLLVASIGRLALACSADDDRLLVEMIEEATNLVEGWRSYDGQPRLFD
jgi:hypothetical protein